MRAIVITGAAGLIGSHLCEAFSAAGWEVRGIDRPDAEWAESKASCDSVAAIDLGKPEGALAAAGLARGAALFAHCAFPRDTADRDAALDSIRAACAAALSAQAPLLLLSSCSVYGRRRISPATRARPSGRSTPRARCAGRWSARRSARAACMG